VFRRRDQGQRAQQQSEEGARTQQVDPALKARRLHRVRQCADPRHGRSRLRAGKILPGEGRGAFLVGEQANARLALGFLASPLCATWIHADHGPAQSGAQLTQRLPAGRGQSPVLDRPCGIVVERARGLRDQLGAGEVEHSAAEGTERRG
jgi:hypothetical protein